MTVDELVHLLEELTGGVTTVGLRQGVLATPNLGDLDDDSYATLLAFVKGERPAEDVPNVSARTGRAEVFLVEDPDEEDDDVEYVLGPKVSGQRQWGKLDGDGRINIPTDRGGSIKLP